MVFFAPVIRASDFLNIIFEFFNLKLDKTNGPPSHLTPVEPDKPIYIGVLFPPQHIQEQAFFEETPGFGKPEDPPTENVTSIADCRLAGSSRLVFKVPLDATPLEYTLERLLDWSKFELSLLPTALPPPSLNQRGIFVAPYLVDFHAGVLRVRTLKSDPITHRRTVKIDVFDPKTDRLQADPSSANASMLEPTPLHTVIEAPYDLFLSPNKFAAWAHSIPPVSHPDIPTLPATERTELWHTRLGVKKPDGVEEDNDYNRTLRASWTTNYKKNPVPIPDFPIPDFSPPFTESLNGAERWRIVRLTSDCSGWENRVIRTKRLMLSALGCWMDLHYASQPPFQGCELGLKTIVAWRHQATMARDQYVKVVSVGYLLPFGHPASLVKVTERKFRTSVVDKKVAALRQRYFIVIRQPEIVYPPTSQRKGGRENPFRSIHVTTTVTPNLDPPVNSQVEGHGEAAFWPTVNSNPFKFHIIAEDLEGRVSEFLIPSIYVDEAITKNIPILDTVIDNYKSSDETSRTADLSGQKVTFADSESDKSSSNTVLETKNLIFSGYRQVPGIGSSANAPYFPIMESASVKIPSVQSITGTNLPIMIQYYESYVNNGFNGSNTKAQVFAKVDPRLASDLKFDASKSGGVATPNLHIVGLSRKFGSLGGDGTNETTTKNSLDNLSGETGEARFDPEDFFSGMDAKILGGIDLAKIINVLDDGFGDDGKNVPKLSTKDLGTGGFESRLEWHPALKSDEPQHLFNPHAGSSLDIIVTKNSSTEGPSVTGSLKNFDINMFDFITLNFSSFDFTAPKGEKLKVSPKIIGVTFGGPLEFINELKDFLGDIGGSGLGIDVTPSGVSAGITQGIPTVGVGVLTIQNIAFTAGINLPFTGDPVRFRFAFCKREHPFILTIYGLGGGGFFGLDLGADGVELLEASLEFGASIALDIGVASGEVHIMAGIYYKWESDIVLLTGYVRLGGELEILGIISLSLEFYLSLTYADEGGAKKVWGEATLTVEVKVLFFSKSVSMTARREFADPDPIKFANLMSLTEWEEYCGAFA
jgi:hypothetical protein